MNPVFVILVIIGVVVLWFLCSGLFERIGKMVNHVFGDTLKIFKEEEKNKKEDTNNE